MSDLVITSQEVAMNLTLKFIDKNKTSTSFGNNSLLTPEKIGQAYQSIYKAVIEVKDA